MGVLVGFTVEQFRIRQPRIQEARNALRDLKLGMWVDDSIDFQRATFEEMLLAWRWRPAFDAGGDLVGLEFLGQKDGSDREFFETLAPYIESGAVVTCHSDYGSEFMRIAHGTVVYGDSGINQYTLRDFRVPQSKHADAAKALLAIPPDFWFECKDTAALSFDGLLKAWRWNPAYDQSGALIGLAYTGTGTGNESKVFDALGPFVEKGGVVERATEFHDLRCRFDGTTAQWETLRYKGP